MHSFTNLYLSFSLAALFMLTTYVRNFPKMKISLLRVFVRVKSQCLYNYRLKGTHDPEGEALCKGPECLELTAL